MVNRYYRNQAPATFQFSMPPLQAFERSLANAQQNSDENHLMVNNLRNQYIDALPQDRAQANKLQNQWESEIDSLVSNSGTDYSTITRGVLDLTQKMKKELSPGGKGYAIRQNYNIYREAAKVNKERLAKGDITQNQLRLLNQFVNTNYKGVGAADSDTGEYDLINVPDLASFVDPSIELTKLAQGMPRRKTKSIIPTSDGKGGLIYTTKETEIVDPAELRQSATSRLVSDPKYLSLLNQNAELMGLQGADRLDYITTTLQKEVDALVPSYSGNFNDTNEIKLLMDPMYAFNKGFQNDVSMELMKQKGRMALEDHKAMLRGKQKENQDAGTDSDNLSLLTLGQNATGQYPLVDPTRQEIEFPVGKTFDYSPWAPANITLMQRNVSGIKKVDIADILSSPAKYKGKVNTTLLQAVVKNYPDKTASQKWELYNTGLQKDDYGVGIYYHAYETPEAMKRDADVNFPKMATGQLSVQFVDSNTGQVSDVSAAKQRELYSLHYDAKTRKANVSVLGKSSSQTGSTIVGSVMSIPGENGYYIMGDNNERMNQYNNSTRKKAFGFIAADEKYSEPFEVFDGNSRIQVIGIKDYIINPETGNLTPKVRYAPYRGKNSDGTPKVAMKSPFGGTTTTTTPRSPYLDPLGKDLTTTTIDTDNIDYFTSLNEFGEPYEWSPANIEPLIRPRMNVPVNKRSGDKEENTPIE